MSHQPTECALPQIATRHLDLTDPADRRQLAVELARIDTIAAQYREVIRRLPRESDSIAARLAQPTRPGRAYRYCRAILRAELADAYGLGSSRLSEFEIADGR